MSRWPKLSLNEVCSNITDGSHFSPKTSPEGWPYITVRDLERGVIDFDGCKFVDEQSFLDLQRDGCAPQFDDVLFSKDGTVGKVAVVKTDRPFVVLSSLAIIRPNPKVMSSAYLGYVLQSPEIIAEATGRKTGVAIKRIILKHLKSIMIACPPLEEQKRIVAVLDQAFAALDRARALVEANLADAEELFERKLSLAFASDDDRVETMPFVQLCTAVTPKTKIQRKEYLEAGTFPIVSQEADLISGYWNDQSALMGLAEPVVVFGDHTRCLKYIDFDFVIGADGTKVLLPKPGIDPLYLYYGLRSVPLAEKGYARHFKFLKEVSLPKLDLAVQKRVSLRLRSLEAEVCKLSEAYAEKLGELSDLRQSLLHKAFAGELT